MRIILENIYHSTFGIVYEFINEILQTFTGDTLYEFNFKIGFGNIEWINIDGVTLFHLIGSAIIGVIFLSLIWKVFKFFTKLVNRAFGGRKW